MNTPNRAPAEPLRVGILGAGMMAKVCYGQLPQLHKVRERVALVGIASRRLRQAQDVAEAYGIEQAVDSLDALLALDIDAVVNLLPGAAHFDASKAILESGRHLVTEKPITSTLAEADELLDLAAQVGSDRFAELARGALIEHFADCGAGHRAARQRPPRASRAEVVLAAQQSARDGRSVDVASTF